MAAAEPELELASANGLPDSIWFRVAAHLCTHELLGRLALLSAGHASVLAEDGCWDTLALPPGPERLCELLRLMLTEERQLWLPLTRRARVLSLDLDRCGAKAVSLLRDLLLHGLGLDSALRALAVRRIPISWEPDASSGDQARHFTKKDLKLVRPIMANPATANRLFLLEPNELGQLRSFMSGFRHFRLCPSGLSENRPSHSALCISVDLMAEREPGESDEQFLPVPAGRSEAEAALALAEAELGALRHLRQPAHVQLWGGDFDGWLRSLIPRYTVILKSWA